MDTKCFCLEWSKHCIPVHCRGARSILVKILVQLPLISTPTVASGGMFGEMNASNLLESFLTALLPRINFSKEHYIDEVWSSESPSKPSNFTAVPSSYQPDPMYDTRNREEQRHRKQIARQEALVQQRERYLAEKDEEEQRKMLRQKALQSSLAEILAQCFSRQPCLMQERSCLMRHH